MASSKKKAGLSSGNKGQSGSSEKKLSPYAKKYRLYKASGASDEVRSTVDEILEESDDLLRWDWWGKYRGFQPQEWSLYSKKDDSWTPRSEAVGLLQFSFKNEPGSLRVHLILFGSGSGMEVRDESLLEDWHAYAVEHNPPGGFSSKKGIGDWNTSLYISELLGPYPADISKEELRRQLRRGWKAFRDGDYQTLLKWVRAFPRSGLR